MRIFNRVCAGILGVGVAMLFGGIFHVTAIMAFGHDLIPPPISMWVGMLIVISAMALFFGGHLMHYCVVGKWYNFDS